MDTFSINIFVFIFFSDIAYSLLKHTIHANYVHFFEWNHIYFVHQKCAFTLTEREQRYKNRLGVETLRFTAAHATLLLDAHALLQLAVWMHSLNMHAEKNSRCSRAARDLKRP